MRCILTLLVVLLLIGCGTQSSEVKQNVTRSATSITSTAIYLHGAGAYNNPPNLFLDAIAPTGTQVRYKDSGGVHFSGGNPWTQIGTWSADSTLINGSVVDLSDLHIWAGLRNSDDQGTHFDVRAEIWQDYPGGTMIGSGEIYNITNLARNPSLAREIVIPFSNIVTTGFDGSNNVLELRILTRIGTDGNGNFAGGHANATGLRAYFDSTARSANSGVAIRVNDSPVAIANVSPPSGLTPLTVDFSATGSYDPDGTIAQYEWDLGDGVFQDYTASDGETSHVYTVGTYVVVLRVTDNDGGISTSSATVEVTTSQGDWWMFGRDIRHTRQSPFTGPSTNELKWTFPTNNIVFSSAIIDADGTVYIGSHDYKIYAINPDGTLKWSYTTEGAIFSSLAIATDGTIYAPCYSGKIYAIDSDGSMKWSYQTGGRIQYSSPAIGTDGMVYIGSRDSKLYAINPDGNVEWTYTTSSEIYSSPAIGTDGTVYIGSIDNKLYAIDSGGNLKWTYLTGGYIYSSSPAIGDDETIYVGSDDRKLYAINSDGTLRWSYTTGGFVRSSPAIGDDGALYVGSDDGYLYAINNNGTLRWSYAMGNVAYSSPTIGADGTVYVGNMANQIYAINSDGTIKWSYATGGYVWSSPTIGPDGTVYTGSYDGKLYAIGPG